MTRPCSHGFDKPSQCFECMYEGNLVDYPESRAGAPRKAVIAVFDGKCPECGMSITVGQLIAAGRSRMVA